MCVLAYEYNQQNGIFVLMLAGLLGLKEIKLPN
jgi:hypothetical protein